ncbi:MAG: endo alpha-1,4 polygalactosaminidase [Candidatus Riflebacteria bacterium]|nr:endo alpha-1,4 polygalactosaminidase [Candidatus Riflebacteria bacterium]
MWTQSNRLGVFLIFFVSCFQMVLTLPLYSQNLNANKVPLGEKILTWGCVYSRVPVKELKKSLAGLLVIQPDPYTASDVAELKRGNRQVLAYLSVGEAESYRPYFKKNIISDLLIKENPEWKDNFPVKFWDPAWEIIVSEYAETIAAKGFNGFVLDVVDAWEVQQNKGIAKAQMTELILSIVRHLRKDNPDLVFIVLNSHALFDDSRFSDEIDGIIQESLYYSWKEAPPVSWQKEKITALKKLRETGKFVGLLEYTRRVVQIAKTKRIARNLGFVPYFTEKKLQKLFPIP